MPSTNPTIKVRIASLEAKKRFEEMAAERQMPLNEFMIAYAFEGYMAEKLGKIAPYQKGSCPYVPHGQKGASQNGA